MNMKNKKFASAVVALAAAVMMPVSQAAALAADTALIQENEIALTAESDTESSAELLAKKAAPAAPAVTSATKNGKQLTVKWKAVSGADGYIVYRYDAATGSYDYFIENTNQYTWEDYTSRPKESGFRYYVLSYVNVNAASSSLTVSGIKATRFLGTLTYSAWFPFDATLSPTLNSVTPRPSAITVPTLQ